MKFYQFTASFYQCTVSFYQLTVSSYQFEPGLCGAIDGRFTIQQGKHSSRSHESLVHVGREGHCCADHHGPVDQTLRDPEWTEQERQQNRTRASAEHNRSVRSHNRSVRTQNRTIRAQQEVAKHNRNPRIQRRYLPKAWQMRQNSPLLPTSFFLITNVRSWNPQVRNSEKQAYSYVVRLETPASWFIPSLRSEKGFEMQSEHTSRDSKLRESLIRQAMKLTWTNCRRELFHRAPDVFPRRTRPRRRLWARSEQRRRPNLGRQEQVGWCTGDSAEFISHIISEFCAG